MNISQFSDLTGLSPHTLRYYEKIGLLASVSRNQSGHRNYSKRDHEWVIFITRLKETGMALNQIMEYAKLREEGIETAEQRMALLEKHSDNLKTRIANDLEHLEALKNKIEYYNRIV